MLLKLRNNYDSERDEMFDKVSKRNPVCGVVIKDGNVIDVLAGSQATVIRQAKQRHGISNKEIVDVRT